MERLDTDPNRIKWMEEQAAYWDEEIDVLFPPEILFQTPFIKEGDWVKICAPKGSLAGKMLFYREQDGKWFRVHSIRQRQGSAGAEGRQLRFYLEKEPGVLVAYPHYPDFFIGFSWYHFSGYQENERGRGILPKPVLPSL